MRHSCRAAVISMQRVRLHNHHPSNHRQRTHHQIRRQGFPSASSPCLPHRASMNFRQRRLSSPACSWSLRHHLLRRSCQARHSSQSHSPPGHLALKPPPAWTRLAWKTSLASAVRQKTMSHLPSQLRSRRLWMLVLHCHRSQSARPYRTGQIRKTDNVATDETDLTGPFQRLHRRIERQFLTIH